MKFATRVTSKGQVTIPEGLRKQAGITQGTVLTWELHEGVLCARPAEDRLSAARAHLRTRAGTWRGKLSGVKLLKLTRRATNESRPAIKSSPKSIPSSKAGVPAHPTDLRQAPRCA